MLAMTKEAVQVAKEKCLHMIQVKFNGRYAKRDTMEVSAPVGPEMAKRIWELLDDLADVKKRMQ